MAIQWRDQPILDSVQLPGGDTKYWIADREAREKIETLIGATRFMGVTTTELTDGATTNPITINDETYTAGIGDIVIYTPNEGASLEFIWDGTRWQLLGGQTIDGLGTLAYKNSAETSYTPEGTINFTNTSDNVLISASLQNLATVVNLSDSRMTENDQSKNIHFNVELASQSIQIISSITYSDVVTSVELTGVTNVVTGITPGSYNVVGSLANGVLPSIVNTSTITAAMGTGTSSTTLIFSFSDIGFTQGQFSQPDMTTIYGLSNDGLPVSYDDIGISYGVSSVLTYLDTSNIQVARAGSVSGEFSLFWNASTTGDITTQSISAITGVAATFAGSASTITVS